ncbi:lyase family protein [Streptomyces sp. NBC_00631]|uniref:lyase family protein n=1 Tax=Streptomyces sp. NBC_00631 TaxID=2975793 RepID=UPI0030E14523
MTTPAQSNLFEPFSDEPFLSVTRGPGGDVGLLGTVRAGSAVESAVSDEAWLRALLDVEAALAHAQAETGLIPKDAARTIAAVARDGGFDPVALAHRARETADPVVALVAELIDRVAETDPVAADHVHRGSTGQDILDSAAMLVTARALDLLVRDLDRVVDALAVLARRHRGTPMAARTLAQHAVPTTFGLKAAGWAWAVHEATEEVARVRATLPVQFGGAAGTLAGYQDFAVLEGLARDGDDPATVFRLGAAFADRLGLAAPALPWHTARGPLVRLGAALTEVTGVLGKFGLDCRNMAATEVTLPAEPGPAGRGASSATPQENNPVLGSLLVSAALQAPQQAAVLGQCMLAADERPGGAWHAEWQPLRELLRLTGGAATAAELAEGLRPDPERMAGNLDLTHGRVLAERLTAHLTATLGRTAAQRCGTRVAADAQVRGLTLAAAAADDEEAATVLTPGELDLLSDAARGTGLAPALTDRVLVRLDARGHFAPQRNIPG